MSELLVAGQTLQTTTGLDCVVETFLGGGGQGEVYKARYCDTDVALKYYFPHVGTPEQRQMIQYLVDKQAPDSRFLWPLEMIDSPTLSSFGYLMALRPKRFKNIVDLMKRRIDPSFKALCTAGVQLADSYLKLHSLGFYYGDISFGNAFFDPDSGEILICDNDNVTTDGPATILGTPRFMAPEIVRGEARPSVHTDLYSLSVLLFYLFVIHHPLEGAREAQIHCLDLPAMNQLYGFKPLFIFDPDDASNRPVAGLHDNARLIWPMLPTGIQNLFTRAFTDGLRDPLHGRVRESEWRNAMSQWRDTIFYCSCGAENFYDRERLQQQGGSPGQCWSCNASLTLPMRMRLDQKELLMLNHDTQLFPHHISAQAMYDFSAPVAEVSRHPTQPQIWGLKNLSNQRWVATMQDGSLKDIEPGRSISLSNGLKLDFGSRMGEVRV